jgi:predicted alpha/beta-fold hydrolase
MKGSAVGSLTMVKVCQRLAFSAVIKSMRSCSTERNPATVFTRIGKKAITAVIRTFEAMPKPNQITSRGASATLGTACSATM